MASRPRNNGPISIYGLVSNHLHVDIQITLVFREVPALPARNTHEEDKVIAIIG